MESIFLESMVRIPVVILLEENIMVEITLCETLLVLLIVQYIFTVCNCESHVCFD